jgi:hypothetical protein
MARENWQEVKTIFFRLLDDLREICFQITAFGPVDNVRLQMFKCTQKITINEAFRNLFVILIGISRCFIGPRNIVSYRLNDGIDIFVMLKQESAFGTAKKAFVEVCV